MATTFTYNDAWSLIKGSYPVSNDGQILEYATNFAVNKMWQAYDWRGSIANLPPFWLVPGEQDYGTPFYVIPTDFYGLREVYQVLISTSNPLRYPLHVVSNLEKSSLLAFPNSICYRDSIKGFRVHPTPSYGMASPQYLIDGTYKTRPPKIRRANLGQVTPWDDVYFNSFTEGLKWAALSSSGRRNDAIAQQQIFYETLQADTASENLELGEPSVAPSEALMLPHGSYGYGAF